MVGRRSGALATDGVLRDDEPRAGLRRPTPDGFFWASVLVSLVPILVATIRSARRGWEPVGDNAYFLIRARDVLTEHHPLLGTWTSASQNTDTNFNNPGPLLFDLLALPAKLGGGIGLAIGVALLNAAALVGMAVLSRRRGGPLVGMAAVAVAAVLCSSMGSQLLFDPWQPHSLLLPFLFTMTAVAAMASGDLRAAPWAVGGASLIVQTHLSYAVLIAALGLWGVVGMACSLRRRRDGDREGWPALRRSATRAGLISAVVLALCWLQPVIENLTSEGQGNLSRLASNATSSAERSIGVDLGTRVVADTLTVPPFWFRPSFEETLRPGDSSGDGEQIDSVDPSFPVAALLLLVLGGAITTAAWDARRRDDRVASATLSTAAVALAAGLVTAWQLPFGAFGVAAHQFRWMWPVGAFIAFALMAYLVRRVSGTGRRVWVVAPVLACIILAVSVTTLPTYNVGSGPSRDEGAAEVMQRARPQMAALEDEGTLLVDFDEIRFAEPYTGPVMAELQRRGIPFVVEVESEVRQLGESRRLDRAAHRLVFREGSRVADVPPGRRVVYVEGLPDAERRQLDRLRTEIAAHLARRGIRTRDLSEAQLPPALTDAVRSDPDAATVDLLLRYRVIVALLDQDLLEVDPGWEARFERYAELQKRWDAGTLALYLAPLDVEGGS